jgi:hypothetical protein
LKHIAHLSETRLVENVDIREHPRRSLRVIACPFVEFDEDSVEGNKV